MATRPRYPQDHDPEIEVRPAAGRYDDFFEVIGVKKPGGGGCWCMSYRDARVPNEERGAYMRDECSREPGPGVLVYVDGEVAGWCSIAPRTSYRRLMNSRTIPILDDRDVWVAVCFVVRAGFRGHGLLHHLLAGAVEHAAAHGAEVVEGYPVDPEAREGAGRVDVISGYVGTTGMFERQGFVRAAETTAHSGGRVRWIMRKELTPA
jgi:GNAT superfamily N-acetyltransferase